MYFLRVIASFVTCFAFLTPYVECRVFDSEFEKKLDSFVKAMMDCRHVPGLTLSATKDNETWTKGYGYAVLSTSRPVDKNTLFDIGSVTKSFTMALLGNLLSERNMTWTTKVQDILGPDYQFKDDYRTREMTLKDLLSHRTGLARLDIGLLSGFTVDTTREKLSKLMKYLPESKPFRDTFIYNNYMFMYLGHICEVMGGDTWENLIHDRLLTPLGMTSTKILKKPQDVLQDNVARPYYFADDEFQNGTLNLYNIYPNEPAGAILSSGKDMTKWMQFLMNKGKLDNGTELVKEELMKDAMKVTTAISDDGFLRSEYLTLPDWPVEKTPIGYGHALFAATYRGFKQIWHSGGLFAYSTLMLMYPDKNTGVFLSINGPGIAKFATFAIRTVLYFASDGALGLEPWLNDTTVCTFPEPWLQDESENSTSTNSSSRTITTPSAYIGIFEHSFLPAINVSLSNDVENKTLNFTMNRMSGVLHATEDSAVFEMEILYPFELMVMYVDQNNETTMTKVSFGKSAEQITSLVLEAEVNITFTKAVPMSRSSTNTNGSNSSNNSDRSQSPLLLLFLICLTSMAIFRSNVL